MKPPKREDYDNFKDWERDYIHWITWNPVKTVPGRYRVLGLTNQPESMWEKYRIEFWDQNLSLWRSVNFFSEAPCSAGIDHASSIGNEVFLRYGIRRVQEILVDDIFYKLTKSTHPVGLKSYEAIELANGQIADGTYKGETRELFIVKFDVEGNGIWQEETFYEEEPAMAKIGEIKATVNDGNVPRRKCYKCGLLSTDPKEFSHFMAGSLGTLCHECYDEVEENL